MLQILRNKAQSIVIQAIVVVIAIVFIFWGVGTNLLNNTEAAIMVNDEEISFQDFELAYDQAYNSMRNQFGGSVPTDLLENLGIKEQVINQLIQEALLRQGAQEMGILISKEEVQEQVREMIQFQDNGQFSIEKYNTLLAANNYTPVKFEDSIRFDMLAQKVQNEIGQFASSVTEHEIEELYTLDKTEISFQYVKVAPGDFTEDIEISEEDLITWYSSSRDNYKTDPQVKLQYLDYSFTSVGEKISIDDAMIENYYQKNKETYTTPEQRVARHILIKADNDSTDQIHEEKRAKAEEILALARGGSDFSELARQYSEGPTKEQGGHLGSFGRGQMVKEFEDAAFELGSGEISDVVKTSFGYHIIKVEKEVNQTTQPLDEVKEEITKLLQLEQAKPLAFQVANEAYEGIISAGSLENYLGKNTDAPLKTTDYFSRKSPPEQLGTDQKFLNTAFELKKKELSSLIETSQGYAILFAEDVKEPVVPGLEEVKDKATLDFKRKKAEDAAKQAAADLLKQTTENNSLSTAAEKEEYTVIDTGFVGKSGSQDQRIPQPVLEAAFKLNSKKPFTEEPIQYGDNHFVIQFKADKKPSEKMNDEDKERYRNAIKQMKQQQILAAWMKNKRSTSKVLTHETL